MNALDIARWQFGITTIYHFLFMPLSIGLSLLIAIMQTAWLRTGSPKYLAMTRFWGKVEAELAVYAGRAQRPAPVSSAFSCRFSDSSSWRPCSENSKRKDGMTSKTAATKITTMVTRTECGADAVCPHEPGPQQPHLERQDGSRDGTDGDQNAHDLRPSPGQPHCHVIGTAKTAELGRKNDGGEAIPKQARMM
jgi:hypothetical protein